MAEKGLAPTTTFFISLSSGAAPRHRKEGEEEELQSTGEEKEDNS